MGGESKLSDRWVCLNHFFSRQREYIGGVQTIEYWVIGYWVSVILGDGYYMKRKISVVMRLPNVRFIDVDS